MKFGFGLLLLLIGCTSFATSSEYRTQVDLMIEDICQRRNVDPQILKTIVETESRYRPWVFNVDMESFAFDSKLEAINAISTISKKPWMVKIRLHDRNYSRTFFPTFETAQSYLNAVHSQHKAAGKSIVLKCQTRKCSLTQPGDVMARLLNVESTDFGLAQINFRFHGKKYIEKYPWTKWFDPYFNLDYAAKHLSDLGEKHQTQAGMVAHYHSRDPILQKIYLEDFNKNWPGTPLVLDQEKGIEVVSK